MVFEALSKAVAGLDSRILRGSNGSQGLSREFHRWKPPRQMHLLCRDEGKAADLLLRQGSI
jgi:hypothetical protein